MIDFFKKMFKPEGSGATARERLRLVLLSDHLSLAPDVVEALRGDLIAVISKYCEVDEANCDVTFEQQDRAVAMLANIPILSVRQRPLGPPGPPAPRPPAPSAPESPPPTLGGPATASTASAAVVDASSAPKRRRRRRRSPGAPAASAGSA